ncbi:MAG: ATP-binding cassette domain-containing protein [Chitinispirillales bacterium]|jgi:phospholipid/cholesterol/gamma-HCH transport system ATP-binding protein|nr:ATP-binding cassette domain-containing protein [Chitinispirillales bacterium]
MTQVEDTPILEIKHLVKNFGSNRVLKNVNFKICAGQIVCVIGQSGHGKSVLMKNIMGLMRPDGGSILFKGDVITSPQTPISKYDDVRHKFGFLFQGAALFDSMTIEENIAFALRERTDFSQEEIHKKVLKSIAMVGLDRVEHLMPADLSGGMRSRVGLARAVVMEPEIMIYDEPTSALDPIMTDMINNLILDLRNRLNMTSIIITHDISSAYQIADKIVMIYEGNVIFEGTPAEIRSSRDNYVQKFIRGNRKIYYALDKDNESEKSIDMNELLNARKDKKFGSVKELNVVSKMQFIPKT